MWPLFDPCWEVCPGVCWEVCWNPCQDPCAKVRWRVTFDGWTIFESLKRPFFFDKFRETVWKKHSFDKFRETVWKKHSFDKFREILRWGERWADSQEKMQTKYKNARERYIVKYNKFFCWRRVGFNLIFVGFSNLKSSSKRNLNT